MSLMSICDIKSVFELSQSQKKFLVEVGKLNAQETLLGKRRDGGCSTALHVF